MPCGALPDLVSILVNHVSITRNKGKFYEINILYDIFSGVLPQEDMNTWILIGDPASGHPAMHCKRYWAKKDNSNFMTSKVLEDKVEITPFSYFEI